MLSFTNSLIYRIFHKNTLFSNLSMVVTKQKSNHIVSKQPIYGSDHFFLHIFPLLHIKRLWQIISKRVFYQHLFLFYYPLQWKLKKNCPKLSSDALGLNICFFYPTNYFKTSLTNKKKDPYYNFYLVKNHIYFALILSFPPPLQCAKTDLDNFFLIMLFKTYIFVLL